jgi:hypothetical protein
MFLDMTAPCFRRPARAFMHAVSKQKPFSLPRELGDEQHPLLYLFLPAILFEQIRGFEHQINP